MESFKSYVESRLNSILIEHKIENQDILKIQRELLKGRPITLEKYYALTNVIDKEAEFILQKFAEQDQTGNITAFFGLSLSPTNHQFIVEGTIFYTWCVVDALLFAEWLSVSALVISNDPLDNTRIELQLETDHLIWSKPYPLYISWVDNIDTCDIRGSLCNNVSFFGSEETANKWLKDNPKGKLLTLENFYESNKTGIKCC